MLKLKKFYKLLLVVSLVVCGALCVLFTGGATIVYADEGTALETPAEGEIEGAGEETGEDDGNGLQGLVDGFLAGLKEKYGDEYETYYNAILEKWGSVEAYLLSLVDDGTIPDVAADGWTAFVHWLGEYAPIWGSILAVVLLIIAILVGRKALRKVAGFVRLSRGDFKKMFACQNKIYKAHIAEMQAIVKLLGRNEQLYVEERKALQESIEEIQKDDEEL